MRKNVEKEVIFQQLLLFHCGNLERNLKNKTKNEQKKTEQEELFNF